MRAECKALSSPELIWLLHFGVPELPPGKFNTIQEITPFPSETNQLSGNRLIMLSAPTIEWAIISHH